MLEFASQTRLEGNMTILVGTCSWADRVQEKVRKLYHTAPSAHLAWIDYGSYDGEDTDDYQCYLN